MTRRPKTEADYPLTRGCLCGQCEAPIVMERRGDGTPWRGGLNYWYTHDHSCEGLERARASMARTTQAITRPFEGRSK